MLGFEIYRNTQWGKFINLNVLEFRLNLRQKTEVHTLHHIYYVSDTFSAVLNKEAWLTVKEGVAYRKRGHGLVERDEA